MPQTVYTVNTKPVHIAFDAAEYETHQNQYTGDDCIVVAVWNAVLIPKADMILIAVAIPHDNDDNNRDWSQAALNSTRVNSPRYLTNVVEYAVVIVLAIMYCYIEIYPI